MENRDTRKRNLMRAAILSLGVCIFMMGASGCMNRNSTADRMVAYMNEKYDDHFEYAAPFGGGPGAVSKQIIVTSEKFPKAQVWVECYEKDGREIFADNYVSYKYEEQTRAALYRLMEDAFHCEAAVFYGVGTKGTANDFTENTTFAEYSSSIQADIGFQACVLRKTSEDDADTLKSDLKKAVESAGLTVFGTIYFTDDPGSLDGFSKLPLKDLDLLDQIHFDMDGPNSFKQLEWRMGNGR